MFLEATAVQHWISTKKRQKLQNRAASNFIFTCSPFIVRHFTQSTFALLQPSSCSFFKFNRLWSLNKWPTRFICRARSMDTTLRFKAMEKESLTSKFLFNRCYIFFILVQYMLVSVQCMKRFRSLPLIAFKIPWHFEGCCWEGMGQKKQNYDRTSEQQSVTSVIFHGHLFKFFICEPHW